MISKKESLIISKIISEISAYLLNEKVLNFNISIDIKNKEVLIIFSNLLINNNLKNDLKKKLSKNRSDEIEIYGWSLLGEGSLDVIGSLVDSINFDNSKLIVKRIINQ